MSKYLDTSGEEAVREIVDALDRISELEDALRKAVTPWYLSEYWRTHGRFIIYKLALVAAFLFVYFKWGRP